MASSKVEKRAAELRDVLDYHLYRYHVLDDPEVTDAEYDVLYDELVRLEEANPELVTLGLADAACRRAAVGQVPEGRAPLADGLAREGHDRRGGREVAPGRVQAARHE